MVEEVGVCDAVDGRVDRKEEEKEIGYVAETLCLVSMVKTSLGARKGGKVYLLVTRGIIFPLVSVSTRSINGIIDKTL